MYLGYSKIRPFYPNCDIDIRFCLVKCLIDFCFITKYMAGNCFLLDDTYRNCFISVYNILILNQNIYSKGNLQCPFFKIIKWGGRICFEVRKEVCSSNFDENVVSQRYFLKSDILVITCLKQFLSRQEMKKTTQ